MMAWYWILLLAIGWIACGVFAYRVFRRPMTENGRLPWTVSDRQAREVVGDDMLNTLIFSKDRPAQLDLLLRSIKRFVVGWDENWSTVLYRQTDPSYHRGYELVRNEHPEFDYVAETDSIRQDIQALTLGRGERYLQFLMDDDVYIRPFGLDDIEFTEFTKDPQIAALVLRMGRAMGYCYTENAKVQPPEFGPKGIWRWAGMPCDWGYPHSVDGTIWAIDDVRRVLTRGPYECIHQLEPALLAGMCGPLALCYDKPRLVSIANNSVQDAMRANRHAGGDPMAMNERFLAGERIALGPLAGIDPPSPHVEFDYEWETK